eukprot:354691-Chlamydomonas_euryale.AAC.2
MAAPRAARCCWVARGILGGTAAAPATGRWPVVIGRTCRLCCCTPRAAEHELQHAHLRHVGASNAIAAVAAANWHAPHWPSSCMHRRRRRLRSGIQNHARRGGYHCGGTRAWPRGRASQASSGRRLRGGAGPPHASHPRCSLRPAHSLHAARCSRGAGRLPGYAHGRRHWLALGEDSHRRWCCECKGRSRGRQEARWSRVAGGREEPVAGWHAESHARWGMRSGGCFKGQCSRPHPARTVHRSLRMPRHATMQHFI